MKILLRLALTVLLLSSAAAQADDPAGTELQRITALRQQPLVAPGASRAETILAQSRRADEVGRLVRDYLERFPGDPRRWDALLVTYQYSRSFITAVDAAQLARSYAAAVTVDQAAKRDWETWLEQKVAALIAAPDVSPETWQGAVASRFASRLAGPPSALAANLAVARADLALLEQRFPDAPQVASSYSRLLYALSGADPAAHLAEVERLLSHPNARVAEIARGLRAVERLKTTPMELKFTAVDGREVDLATLRGKVVLVDFWATWCGPCIAELPNVKRVYATYHDRGFEIVGISLDRAQDRQKLVDFCQREQLPWPQHYDGKWWKNEVALAYSVNAIPAMFLLDQSGRLVTTQARGEKLELEVKRLLGL